jgi:hypothetical protein
MGKKANPTPAAPVEPVEAPAVEPVEAPAPTATNGNRAQVDPPAEEKQPDVKPEVKAETPAIKAPEVDDDVSFVMSTYRKQMVDSITDIDMLRKFNYECEGKSLKQKAEWLSKNKPSPPAPDPSKGLPKGPAGGEKPFSVVDFSNSLVNKHK